MKITIGKLSEVIAKHCSGISEKDRMLCASEIMTMFASKELEQHKEAGQVNTGVIPPLDVDGNRIIIGAFVKLLTNIKDAYSEVWHDQGDVLEVKEYTHDGLGVMFHSDLGTLGRNVRVV